MTRSVLVVLAHPSLQASRVNRALSQAALHAEDVTLLDLYATYPDFYIQRRREQARLAEHDAIVLQHPLYWFGVPSLLKEWLDATLEHDWAYGRRRALEGKTWAHAISAGAPASDFREGGAQRRGLDAYLVGFEQVASVCGLAWQAPFVTYDTSSLQGDALDAQAQRYADWLDALPLAPPAATPQPALAP